MTPTFKIDITFVIDATGSMAPIIETIKYHAISLGDDIIEAFKKQDQYVTNLRVKVIDFADYCTEGDEAIHQTEFFELPSEKQKFEKAINNIIWEYRGGDLPENALEALYLAIKSDWAEIKQFEMGRHIIILITDAPPLKLLEREGAMDYPADFFPKDVEALREIWDSDDRNAKLSHKNRRLILFAPECDDGDEHSWDAVEAWNKTVYVPTKLGRGCEELPIELIISEIVRSC